jgi:hypothetical protein
LPKEAVTPLTPMWEVMQPIRQVIYRHHDYFPHYDYINKIGFCNSTHGLSIIKSAQSTWCDCWKWGFEIWRTYWLSAIAIALIITISKEAILMNHIMPKSRKGDMGKPGDVSQRIVFSKPTWESAPSIEKIL